MLIDADRLRQLIEAVARRAGACQTTAARYVQGNDAIQPSVRRRIEAALRELGRADLIRPQEERRAA